MTDREIIDQQPIDSGFGFQIIGTGDDVSEPIAVVTDIPVHMDEPYD